MHIFFIKFLQFLLIIFTISWLIKQWFKKMPLFIQRIVTLFRLNAVSLQMLFALSMILVALVSVNIQREMQTMPIKERKELLKALATEIDINLEFADKLYAGLEEHLNGEDAMLNGVFYVDILNSNLERNTIQSEGLLSKAMKLKNAFIVCNQQLEFTRSGLLATNVVTREYLLDRWKGEEGRSYKLSDNDKRYFEDNLESLPDSISVIKSRIFDILYIIYGNHEIINTIRGEIKDYERGIALPESNISFKQAICNYRRRIDMRLALWFIGLLAFVFLGNFVPRLAIKKLKEQLGDKPGPFISYLGFFEILSYAVSYILGYPIFIVAWLGLKMVGRWKVGASADKINIFLLGNLIAVFTGVLGGILFKWLLVMIGCPGIAGFICSNSGSL